ncbi:hypothetical protein [Hydrogenophaga sp.]|nr:hypothetical protein [Hydrogenophaga sp.]
MNAVSADFFGIGFNRCAAAMAPVNESANVVSEGGACHDRRYRPP